MSAAAKSLFAFGIYAVVAGATLIIVPNLLITTLGFPPARHGWVRVVGALALFVGIYHIVCARNELLAYVRATVWARLGFAAVLALLVITSQMPVPLLLFAAIDVAGALWTGVSLRRVSAP